MSKLLIIGNGFDMAHEYKTSYKDFSETLDTKIVDAFQTIYKRIINDADLQNINWYNFENVINIASYNCAQKRIETILEPSDVWTESIHELNLQFEEIRQALIKYLREAYFAKKIRKLRHVQNQFSEDSYVITFNYTPTAERYISKNNICHVHGSLEEDYIVFGYPFRDESDMFDAEDTRFAKEKQRELLNFWRFALSQSSITDDERRSLLQDMVGNIDSLFSGRGEYDFETSEEELPVLIQKYGELYGYRPAPLDFGVDFSQITEIVILGHSLCADEDIVRDQLIKKCINLKGITLFFFYGESQEDIKKKIELLNSFSGGVPVVLECYTTGLYNRWLAIKKWLGISKK